MFDMFVFSALQVRKVVMDTMKNIHPIYNIKVHSSCWSCTGITECLERLHSCPMRTFSILVLDLMTETSLSGFDAWSWGHEKHCYIYAPCLSNSPVVVHTYNYTLVQCWIFSCGSSSFYMLFTYLNTFRSFPAHVKDKSFLFGLCSHSRSRFTLSFVAEAVFIKAAQKPMNCNLITCYSVAVWRTETLLNVTASAVMEHQHQKKSMNVFRRTKLTIRVFGFPCMLFCLAVRHWWSNRNSPGTQSCERRTGSASCQSSATRTCLSGRNLRRRAWRKSTHPSLLHSQKARSERPWFMLSHMSSYANSPT